LWHRGAPPVDVAAAVRTEHENSPG
jgi:hypothetical protein